MRCQTVCGASHSGQVDLCLHAHLHLHILLENLNSCYVFHCLQRIHNGEGGEMKIPIFVCMSVCRFDVLLGGGGVGQEMVLEE